MRKLFYIFLAFSLLISTAGYAVTKHFCEDVLVHISVGHETTPCCDSNEMSSDCECESETDHVVVDDYQLDHQEVKLTPALQATLAGFFRFLAFAPLAEDQSIKSFLTLKYPPFTESRIHVRVQSFLL